MLRWVTKIVCLQTIVVMSAWAAPTVCKVKQMGAKGDGTNKDTIAIQHAIDSCVGHVLEFESGTYLSGPIVLRSHTTLRLDQGATLLGSADHADYLAKVEFREPDVEPLVRAENAEDIVLEGEGTIDGNGASWWAEARAAKDHGVLGVHPRPKLIIFDHTKHVRVEGITIQNSPMWQLVPYYADDVVIRNVRVLAPSNSPNTDAIDPFSSTNVVIDHVLADVGDDDVAIKSGAINSPGPDAPSANIVIRDCTFLHGHGLSIGSEIAGGAHNILAERIRFEGTDNGIRVKANRDRGNDVSNLVFRDITMKDVKNAVIISAFYPKVMPPADLAAAPLTRLTPHFHDIVLERVTAVGSETAAAIVGLPEAPVKNVVLRQVSIEAQKGAVIGYAEVETNGFTVQAAAGEVIEKMAGAQVYGK